jgi:hypothetical protein
VLEPAFGEGAFVRVRRLFQGRFCAQGSATRGKPSSVCETHRALAAENLRPRARVVHPYAGKRIARIAAVIASVGAAHQVDPMAEAQLQITEVAWTVATVSSRARSSTQGLRSSIICAAASKGMACSPSHNALCGSG